MTSKNIKNKTKLTNGIEHKNAINFLKLTLQSLTLSNLSLDSSTLLFKSFHIKNNLF